MANNNQSIIVKKIKKVSGGHHGGAWKVAYADFVTAMMAFFLLLWLLNATEAENLAGLADYFAPTVGVKDEMGIGFRGGKAALSEGIGADKNTNKGIVFGGVPTGPITKVTQEIEERTDQEKQEQIQVVINEVSTDKKGSADSEGQDVAPQVTPAATPEASEELLKTEQAVQTSVQDMVKNRRIDEGSIEIKRTPEGLMIEIKDITGNSMFENDSAVMKDKFRDALVELSKILKNVPNNLAIIGHTSSAPIQSKISGYTKWELSADRANATRNFLNKNGVDEEQFSRIEGRADNVPYDKRKPESGINNRINIIILDKNDTPNHKKSAPESILIDTKSEQTKKFLEDIKKPEEKKEEIKPQNNQEFKNLLNDQEKELGALPTEKRENILNSDVIDFKKTEKPVAPAAPLTKQNNSQFQDILNEADKAANAAAVPAAKNTADVNNIIDLKIDRHKKAEPAAPAGPNRNKEFLKILNETEKQGANVP